MSTPTSERRAGAVRIRAALASLFVLGGCVGGGGTGGAPAQAVVTSGAVVIAGPHGFCVDETATRIEGDTAFVLLGNCAAISNAPRADQPEVPVVLTAAVSDASDAGSIAESLEDLDGYFRSDEGRGLLSRTQDPDSVTVLSTMVEGETFLLHASDASAGAMPGVSDDYWRAYFDLGPRIVTLSVFALEDRGVAPGESLGALRAFAESVRAANAAPPAEGDPVAPVPAPETAPRGGFLNVGLFRRIFD
jgi:hypothetical protein